ncbi:hypothetical protein ACW9KT_21765 [Hymenobacter sp. HD11105]
MPALLRCLFLGLLLLWWPFSGLAQSPFSQGQLIYQADTVRRLEAQPAAYVATQLLVYRQRDAVRLEVWRVNRWNPADTTKEVQLRTKTGTYTWVEYSDRERSAASNFALFMSYAEEKQAVAQQARSLLNTGYRVERVIQPVQWLGWPAQQVALRPTRHQEAPEAILTTAITLPLGAVFPFLRSLPGTPLQFTEGDRGWLTRFTAKTLRMQPLPDQLFEVEPTRQLMSMQQMLQKLSKFD